MIYQFSQTTAQIELNGIDASYPTIGMISLGQLEEAASLLKFAPATVKECMHAGEHFRTSIDVYDSFSFTIINIVDIKNTKVCDKVGVYVKKNLVLFVDILDKNKSTNKLFESVIERFNHSQVTIERLLFFFLDKLIMSDGGKLEEMELHISRMEENVQHPGTAAQFNSKILALKKCLLILRNYYEQLIDIGEDFAENSNDVFNIKELRYFKLFTNKACRLSANVQMLREYLVQVREAYQSALDYNLNSILKVFTVVTTIFLPLTLIVGWYGMNFKYMPELTWKYGYLGVLGLSAAVIVVCIVYFKKKKLF